MRAQVDDVLAWGIDLLVRREAAAEEGQLRGLVRGDQLGAAVLPAEPGFAPAAVERLQACIADRDAETRGVLEKAKATEANSLKLRERLAAAEANAAAYTAKYHLLEASTSAGSARVRAIEERMTGPRPASFLSFLWNYLPLIRHRRDTSPVSPTQPKQPPSLL